VLGPREPGQHVDHEGSYHLRTIQTFGP